MDNNRCSVTLEDDGSVTFYMYAPNANKVEVAGMGGYFSSERIRLKPDMQGDVYKRQGKLRAGSGRGCALHYHVYVWNHRKEQGSHADAEQPG